MRAGANAVTIWALPLAILVASCVLVVSDFGGVASRIRGFEFDLYQRAKPRLYEDTKIGTGHAIRVLDADGASIARFGRWPWSRNVLARLTAELKAQGAALVVFDIGFEGPDPESVILQALPADPSTANLRAALAALPSPDETLASAIARVPAVTGFTLGEPGRMPLVNSDLALPDASADIAKFEAAAAAPPSIEKASAGVGARNLPVGPDGEVRRDPLVFRLAGKPVASLDAEALRLLSATPEIDIRSAEAGLPGLARMVVTDAIAKPYDVALGPSGAVEIYFSKSEASRFISAAALDAGTLPTGTLKDAVVYIAPPNDMLRTPLGPLSRGEFHAQALENMVLGTELKPASTPGATLVVLVIVGVGLVFLLARGSLISAGALTLAVVAGAQALGWFLFAKAQMLLDAANPSVALSAAYLAGFAARQIEITRARAQLRTSFSDSLPTRTVVALARSPARLNLAGETREVTCLSCGVRRFSTIADSFVEDPAGFTRLMNTAIAPLLEDAVDLGGMIAHFDGGTFMACWNAPLDDPEHAIHACEAANRMTTTVAEVNEQLARERRLDGTPYQAIEIGIGISTGRAIAGGFTAHGRTIYSVTGDSTVMADKIRALSDQYGPAVIVSEDARKAAQRGYAFLEVDFIAAGPRDEPVKLYAMLGNPLVRASPKFRALETFHEHIFQSVRLQQWEKARGLIEQCRKLSGASQKIYDLHLARIAYYESNPPGADWDGVFRPILK